MYLHVQNIVKYPKNRILVCIGKPTLRLSLSSCVAKQKVKDNGQTGLRVFQIIKQIFSVVHRTCVFTVSNRLARDQKLKNTELF